LKAQRLDSGGLGEPGTPVEESENLSSVLGSHSLMPRIRRNRVKRCDNRQKACSTRFEYGAAIIFKVAQGFFDGGHLATLLSHQPTFATGPV
jgi:hypothetical protein